MKRILLAIAFAVICTASAFSQIQNTFFGLTLGKSSREAALTQLRELGYNPVQPDGFSFYITSCEFAGETWPVAIFHYFRDIITSVWFINTSNTTPKVTLKFIGKNLQESFDKKYSGYIEPQDEKLEESDNSTLFSDGVTKLAFINGETNTDGLPIYRIILIYDDIEILEQIKKDANGEL